MQIFISKQVNVKSINVTIKHVIKGIQRIEDMDKPVNFIQNVKKNQNKINKERREEHREEMKRRTEHTSNLISEIAVLNTDINIKVNNIV